MKKIILFSLVLIGLTACASDKDLTVGEFKLLEKQMGLDKVEGI